MPVDRAQGSIARRSYVVPLCLSSVCEKTLRYHAVFAPIVCFAGSGLLVRTVVVACPPYNRAPGTLACKPVLASLARSDLNESEERERK